MFAMTSALKQREERGFVLPVGGWCAATSIASPLPGTSNGTAGRAPQARLDDATPKMSHLYPQREAVS